MNIVDGVATTNNFKAVMNTGSLAANGSLNLVTEGINMHMLANIGSGVSLPVLVGGTTSHMSFTPDMQALAKMKLGAGGITRRVEWFIRRTKSSARANAGCEAKAEKSAEFNS